MNAMRAYLVFLLVALGGYTWIVGNNHGWNLVPIFFRDIAALNWPGQFNMDFMCFLSLSAFWTAWRNEFGAVGLGLAVVAFFGGMMFLATYLLFLIGSTGGDAKRILLGDSRAG